MVYICNNTVVLTESKQVGLPPGRCLKCACVLINKENIACPHDYGIIHDTT